MWSRGTLCQCFLAIASVSEKGERRCWKPSCRRLVPFKHWPQCSPGAPCWERGLLPEFCSCWCPALTNRQCITFDLCHPQSENPPELPLLRKIHLQNVFLPVITKAKILSQHFISNRHLFGIGAVFIFLSSFWTGLSFTDAFKHTHDVWVSNQNHQRPEIIAISSWRVPPQTSACFRHTSLF